VTSLDEAPESYAAFDKGAAEKFVIDPHGSIPQAA
jgi:glutathione-independent formaldehyde dehydrogenase